MAQRLLDAARMKACLALILFAAACAVPAPVVRYEAANDQVREPAATAPSSVRVMTKDELPEGFTLDRMSLSADPGIPSLDAPHVVLGEVRIRLNTRQPRAMWLQAMQVEAAKHGANAVVVLDETGDDCYSNDDYKCRLGVAVHLSDAPPDKLAPAADVLASWLAEHKDKGAATGAPHELDLAAPKRITFTPKRGECTTVVLALDADAHVARHGTWSGVTLDAVSAADHVHRENFGGDNWGLRDRALSVNAGCAQDSSTVTVSVYAGNEGTPAGRGHAIVQLLQRKVDDATLAQMAQDEADEMEQADDEHARLNQEACDRCIDEWKLCVRLDPAVERDECPNFDHCVERAYGNPQECR
ncbi:MAG TPA: hypothetical protein VL463_05480 [Kofleriaceae bacterium]|nr:hypothetical protein [Kofleriaceae bacterium]